MGIREVPFYENHMIPAQFLHSYHIDFLPGNRVSGHIEYSKLLVESDYKEMISFPVKLTNQEQEQ